MVKPILVTGGAGFIGSHLIDLFDRENVNYRVLDNLSSGSISNIPLAISKNRFIKGDVKDYQLLEKLISDSSSVIHLACTVGVRNVIANPLETIETNVNSVQQIAFHCSKVNIPLVFFSTSLVYSQYAEKKSLFSEDSEVHGLGFHPVSIYVSAKRMGELICRYYKERMNLKYIIVRPFNMVGIRQKGESGMVIPSFINSAISDKTINIYGNGKQTRTFSDVKTAVKILWELLIRENSYNQVYNLATTENPSTILELAEKIRRLLNNDIKINFVPISEVYGHSYRDVNYRSPSLAKLKVVVSDWKTRSLEEILKEIIEHEQQKVSFS